MDDKKICFIMCSNDEVFETECIRYIDALTVPQGYTVEHIVIRDACSMTSGYNEAMENIKPALEVKSRRVGGSNVQVPIEVTEERSQALALRWLVNYAKLRNGKGMAINLANEIMDAAKGVGGAVKKREDTHKMAEANKAFAHYRW